MIQGNCLHYNLENCLEMGERGHTEKSVSIDLPVCMSLSIPQVVYVFVIIFTMCKISQIMYKSSICQIPCFN